MILLEMYQVSFTLLSGKCKIPEVTNGSVNPHETGLNSYVKHGESIEIDCNKGNKLNSHKKPTCSNGTWSVIPACEPGQSHCSHRNNETDKILLIVFGVAKHRPPSAESQPVKHSASQMEHFSQLPVKIEGLRRSGTGWFGTTGCATGTRPSTDATRATSWSETTS